MTVSGAGLKARLDGPGISGENRASLKDNPLGSADVTTLLRAWTEGDVAARDRVVSLVYPDLRRRAAGYLRQERRDHTLQPTALINEVYLRLVNQRRCTWENRAQFFGVAAQMMRRILVDHARGGRRAKRSGAWTRIPLSDCLADVPAPDVEVLDLDAALTALTEFDARKSRIAELRFFGGLSLQETAHALDLSIATVERDWQAARAWLFAALKGTLPRGPRLARDH